MGPHALTAVIACTALFGALLVALPEATRQAFAWLLYGDAARMAAWPDEARAYVTLLHGVLGAVMIGWAVALAWLRRQPHAVAFSVGVWFVVDTAWSAAMGAWPNVALNSGFGLAYALALSLAWPRGAAAPR